MAMQQSRLERENLEAHVDLCAERYRVLEEKLNKLDEKFDRLEEMVREFGDRQSQEKQASNKMMWGATATVIAGLLSTIVVILMQGV
jgi:hypothetical protein